MGRYEYSTTGFLRLSLCFMFFSMVFSQLSPSQTNTMKNLYQLLKGSVHWNNSIGSNPCGWNGVKCDSGNSSVIEIDLSGLTISSWEFLPVLCEINSLQHIDISNNFLSSIPHKFITDCAKIEGLKLLNFSKNLLVGDLPTFAGFDGLESLDMSFNRLGGRIDSQLAGLVSLKKLNLSNNNFGGSVPANLSMALEQLVLSANNLAGNFPDQILGCKNLTLIDLSANNFLGSVPGNIGDLSKLQVLVLSSNLLNGEIPQTLSSITTLRRFAANQNKFSGPVPRGITTYLEHFDLSYNYLSGPIPSDLLASSKLELVDLSNNSLSGLVPADISSNLVRLRLGGNSLNGTITSVNFAAAQNLMYMELNNNRLTGLIPPGLESCRKLALLNLAQNQFTGVLPSELGNLSNLQVLKLQMNKLNGSISIPMAQLQKLSTLNLSWNSLTGSIPSTISSLKDLANLNLQQNNLIGSIPESVSSLTSLIELQLGGNQLSGLIPKMPPSLQITLNLSYNRFEGPIPSSLDGLINLEVLDLSNNKFSGNIPEFLTKLQTLTQLILSNNQLYGIIPKFGPYVVVESSGNKGLKNNTDQGNPPAQQSTKGKSVTLAILVAIAAAIFLAGLVAVLVVVVSRHYYKVNNVEHLQLGEELNLPQVIGGNLLTPNGIHRSNIDFSKAMEAVAETSNITLKTRFSAYYKAVMPSGVAYFVKKLNWSDKIFPQGSHDKFGKELEVLAKLNNSNVMTPLAYVLSTDSAYILYEFISNGSLFDVLHGRMGNSLDWASRYSIAVGVAQGLSFLHGYASGPILLLDLSSKTIMLKSFKEPLVGDIELYKVIDPTKSTGSFSAVAGSVGYIPPEYAYTMRVTSAGNVYSFGVILLELLTGKPAVTEGTELVKWVLRNSTKQDHILDFHVSSTSQAVRDQMLAILKIALVCVSTSPDARPKMKTVLRMLLNAR